MWCASAPGWWGQSHDYGEDAILGGNGIATDEQRQRILLARRIAGPAQTPDFVARIADVEPAAAAMVLAEGSQADSEPAPTGPVAEEIRVRTVEALLERWWDDTDLGELVGRLDELFSPPVALWVQLAERAVESRSTTVAAHAFAKAAAISADRGLITDELFELVLLAAEHTRNAGDPSGHQRHIAWALQLAKRSGGPDLLARVLAEWFDPGFTVDESRAVLFDRAWAGLTSPDSALAVDLLCSEVFMTYLTDPVSAAAIAERAENLAQQLGDHDALVAAADARRVAAIRASDPKVFEQAGDDLLRLARSGDLEARSKAYVTLITSALIEGDEQRVDREVSGYRSNAAQSQSARRLVYADQVATLRALLRGELSTAATMVEAEVVRAAELNDAVALQVSMAQQAFLAYERDESSGTTAISLEQSTNSPLLRMWNLAVLLVGMRVGNEGEVAAALDVLVPTADSLADWQYVWLGELMVLGDAVAFAGDSERSRWVSDRLDPHATRFGVMGTAIGFGSVARTLASLSVAAGDHETAEQRFKQADTANRRIGALPWVARGQLAQARHHMQIGQTESAAELIASAGSIASRLGLARLEREVGEVGSQLAVPSASAGETLALPGLSQRENELIDALARGRSNRQIAEELFVSIKTVERHLSNIYAKVGARGRADAVAWAFENGLELRGE